MKSQPSADNPSKVRDNLESARDQDRPSSTSLTAEPRRQLGRWTLLKPLARGGMGEVYLGTAGGIEGAERPCVIKIIRREHQNDSSFLARFFDEARIQAQLQHPGVAGVLEASTDQGGSPYVVLEYVEGRNLSELRQRASQLKMPLSWADAVAIAVSLAEGLAHVHERTDATGRALSIVHRDMSPQNVMVGYAGDVKLIDFGTARGENRRCQTVSGVVFAKPGYVAPEVANQNQPGPQADLYALGIILWELVVGRRFLTGDASEHLAKVASGERVPQPVSRTANVPLELDTVIARLTAPELKDRTATAREALADLVRVLSRAPSLADGERSVRGRIAHLMNRLYPSEPARSRAEFARLLIERRQLPQPDPFLPESPVPADPSTLLPGTRYKLIRQIAKSTMSVVFEGVHVDLERKVALKVLPRERCENPHFEMRFRREARALAQLRHEGLVTLHDFGVSQDGRPFYAMELLEGETLKQRSETSAIPWKEAVAIAISICGTLEVCHTHGVIHKDIKPANIFLAQGRGVKVIDFGVAQAGPDDAPSEAGTDHSGALRVTGTPEYMAPEQVGDDEVGAGADIYATGTLLYELLTGRLPYQAESTVALLNEKRRQAPTAPSRVRTDLTLPRALDLVLMRALNPNPTARYASAQQFKLALEQVLAGQSSRGLRTTALATASAAVALALGLTASQLYAGWSKPGAQALPQASAPSVAQPARAEAAAPERPQPVTVEAPAPAANPAATVNDAPETNAALDVEDVGDADLAAPEQPETTDPKEAPASDADLPKETRDALVRADKLLKGDVGQKQQGLEIYRGLGKAHPDHPRILEGWSRAASVNKWWGEALRAALRWASLDASPQAQLYLARTQRLVGQRYGAIQTLERLLSKEPKHQEAQAMLERYRAR
jgi:eukaryotic-like serine/threonine-protein kinase